MKPTKSPYLVIMVSLLAFLAGNIVAAPIGTAFTYQGKLKSGTDAATGLYDFSFALFDAASSGTQKGPTVNTNGLPVTNGLFTATLDFGNVFDTTARWLAVWVKTNGAATYTPLTPRQPLTPTPCALTASNLLGLLPATQLTGVLPATQLSGTYTGSLTFNNAGNSFTGNGSGLSSLNPAGIAWGGCPPWNVCGNAGTIPGTQFLGTTDSQDLWLKVNNQVGWRLLRSSASATEPNLAGGGSSNAISSSAKGCGILAGNSNTIPASANYSTVGGGQRNTIQTNANSSTIAGGRYNTIQSSVENATIGGGTYNSAAGDNATVGGGYANTERQDRLQHPAATPIRPAISELRSPAVSKTAPWDCPALSAAATAIAPPTSGAQSAAGATTSTRGSRRRSAAGSITRTCPGMLFSPEAIRTPSKPTPTVPSLAEAATTSSRPIPPTPRSAAAPAISLPSAATQLSVGARTTTSSTH